MLRHPNAGPGCVWMKRWDERLGRMGQENPQTQTQANPRTIKWFWSIYAVVMLVMFLGLPFLSGPHFSPQLRQPYESSARLAGLPLFAYGEAPRGIIAVGGRPRGVLAVGSISIGLISVGGVAFGGIAFGGLSVGILALAGGAAGWWAVGGGAFGRYAFGGLAIGDCAYAGNGVAIGRHEASGRQKEKLLG